MTFTVVTVETVESVNSCNVTTGGDTTKISQCCHHEILSLNHLLCLYSQLTCTSAGHMSIIIIVKKEMLPGYSSLD